MVSITSYLKKVLSVAYLLLQLTVTKNLVWILNCSQLTLMQFGFLNEFETN